MLLKSHFSMLIKYLLNWMTGWILSYKNTSSLPIRWDIIHMYIRAVSIANVKIGILTLFKIRHFAVSSVTIMCGGGAYCGVELYLHSPNTPSWCGAQLKHRNNFTFYGNC